MMESMGIVAALIFTVSLITIFILTANWVLSITKLKKDLVEQEKIVVKVKVKRIEQLSDKDVKELIQMGSYVTHDIHFEKNDYKIKHYSFNKAESPELLETKEMILELAKNSKIELKREIIN